MTTTGNAQLPLPPFYLPAHASRIGYGPDQMQLADFANDWGRKHEIKPAGSDRRKVHLLLIDVQKDFCFPEGSLFVAGRSGNGAIADNQRLAEFIYRNLHGLTAITTTMDTHFAYQIFSPAFWLDGNDQPLGPHREITADEIDSGKVKPNPAVARWLCNGNYAWLLKQVKHYCAELEKAGKYKLYLWPPHCLLGSEGHTLAGVIHEARLFHSYVRGAQSYVEGKGGNPLTENYSVLRPEVLDRFDGQPLAQRNTAFLETLLEADALLIAGQAASHCVKSTIDDLLDEIQAADPQLARKVHILEDCMSAVTVPDGKGGFLVDYTQQAQDALARFANAGMRLNRSTQTLEEIVEENP